MMRSSLLFILSALQEPAAEGAADAAAASGTPFWLWAFLGRLHPMIVHFPVSLLVLAMLIQLFTGKRKSGSYEAGIRLLIYVGAASSVVAVILGLLLINTEEYGSSLVSLHQWTGIATMVLGCLTALAYWKQRLRIGKILLFTTAIGVTVAGHYGASLTHGDDYLTSVLPSSSQPPAGEGAQPAVLAFAAQKGPLNDTQVQELNLQVRTILAHNCNSCHGSAKVKGELRLDTKEFAFKGGKHGPVIVPGNTDKSELMKRIMLPRDHKEAMPNKGKGLTKDEIAVLGYWIQQGAPWPDGPLKSLYRVAALEPRMPAIPAAAPELVSPIDHFVDAYFKKHQIKWSQPVDDHTYIRRVYLDVTGLLPQADSVDAFARNTDPHKRETLVSNLLGRDEAYTQHWLTFWNDALRNDYSGPGYITGGRSDITKWLYASLKENKPYNTFVKELISPTEESKGFIGGIKWRGSVNASQRIEMQAAQNVSQVLLGLNLKCASCHDSFISDLKLDEAYAFANVFSDTTLEINRCDKPTGQMASRRILFKELGVIDPNASTKDRLKQLAEYLAQPKDGRLYRTVVNRIWAQVMGRGIVEPVDIMDNEPWSQDLLDYMASDFTATGYDLKKLLYNILTSRTYQLPSVTVKDAGMITANDFVFKGMLRRRLTAEQFADAVSTVINQVYPDSAVASKRLPADIKEEIPFVRAALVKNDAFQKALGRPTRETVSTSRTSQASLLQALELTNGTQFNEAVKRGAAAWKQRYPDADTMVKEIYRQAFGRTPSADELNISRKALGNAPAQENVQDLLWALTLHPEFQLIY